MFKNLKKYLLKARISSKNPTMKILMRRLYHPEIYKFNKKSVARGTAFGLLVAFIPLPGQSLLAAILAYLGRGNLPVAVAMTWVSNPFTFFPINYAIYKLGQFLTNEIIPYQPLAEFDWQNSGIFEIIQHLWVWISQLSKPFLIGTLSISLFSSVLGYFSVKFLWRIAILWRSYIKQKSIK